MHRHLGDQRMREIIERLSDISRVEIPPRLAGRRMSVILAPEKSKIDAILRRNAAAAKQAAKESSSSGDGAQTQSPARPTKPVVDRRGKAPEPVEIQAR
jgi:hypothetical protein